MRKQTAKPRHTKAHLAAAWRICAVTGLALLLLDYFILPTLLNQAFAKPLLLPIIQTILLYGALFLGIVAFVIIVNDRLFNTDIKQKEKLQQATHKAPRAN